MKMNLEELIDDMVVEFTTNEEIYSEVEKQFPEVSKNEISRLIKVTKEYYEELEQ